MATPGPKQDGELELSPHVKPEKWKDAPSKLNHVKGNNKEVFCLSLGSGLEYYIFPENL